MEPLSLYRRWSQIPNPINETAEEQEGLVPWICKFSDFRGDSSDSEISWCDESVSEVKP